MTDKVCMTTPKSMEELTDIASKEDIVLFLNKADCPHCHEMKPVLEKECQNNREHFNFINCPVEQKHCMDLAKAIKIGGVPYTAAIPRGKSVKDKIWELTGFSNDLAGKLKSNLSKSIAMKNSGNGASHQPASQPQAPQPQRRAPPRVSLPTDSAILDTLRHATDPTVTYGFPSTATFNAPKKIDICIPGKECSREEAEQKIIDFYLQW